MRIYADRFDRSRGNGARSWSEDRLDENTTASENQWSSASTTFYKSEVPSSQKQQYERIYDWQHDKGRRDRSSQLMEMRMLADADAFCSMLEFSRPLTNRVEHIMQESDISANNFGGKSYEKIILAVSSLVHDENLSSQEEPDFDERLIFDETFRELMESVSMGSRELRTVRQQVREKTEHF